MNARLTEARNNESGFTLVELLVVIGIIAILTAIAVPMFLSQRQKANDAAVRSDVKNIVTEVETGAVDNPGKVTFSLLTKGKSVSVKVGDNGTVEKVNLSDGVTVGAAGDTTAATGYQISGFHDNGKQFKTATEGLVYNSADGGFQDAVGAVPTVS